MEPTTGSRSSNNSADVVVIGGGVIGTCIAYYLAQRKFGRIVVLERDTLGSGSTGRSVAELLRERDAQHPDDSGDDDQHEEDGQKHYGEMAGGPHAAVPAIRTQRSDAGGAVGEI